MFSNGWLYRIKTTFTHVSDLKWTQTEYKCCTQNTPDYWNYYSNTTAVTIHSIQQALLLTLQITQHTRWWWWWRWWCMMLCDRHIWKFMAVQSECNAIFLPHVSTDRLMHCLFVYCIWSMIEVIWKLSVKLTVLFNQYIHSVIHSIAICRMRQFLAVLRSFFHSFMICTFPCHPSPPTILPSSLTSNCHLFLGLPINLVVPKFTHNTYQKDTILYCIVSF